MTGIRTEKTVSAQPKSARPTMDPLAIKSPPGNSPGPTIPTQAPVPEPAGPNAVFSVANLVSRTIEPQENEAVYDGPRLSYGLTQKLWETRISAPDPNEDAESKAALDRLIQQIRAVKFEPKDRSPTFSVPAEPQPPEEPNEIRLAPTPMPRRVIEPATTTVATSDAAFSSDVQETLNKLIQDPNQLNEPLEIAELLFLSNHPVEAAICYRKALDRMDAQGAPAPQDRAWVLFQLGNCLRETDMARANHMYTKLVAEYPDSPWSELAEAHRRLISWYQKAKPRDLVRGHEP